METIETPETSPAAHTAIIVDNPGGTPPRLLVPAQGGESRELLTARARAREAAEGWRVTPAARLAFAGAARTAANDRSGSRLHRLAEPVPLEPGAGLLPEPPVRFSRQAFMVYLGGGQYDVDEIRAPLLGGRFAAAVAALEPALTWAEAAWLVDQLPPACVLYLVTGLAALAARRQTAEAAHA